jgi:hypothetical protein
LLEFVAHGVLPETGGIKDGLGQNAYPVGVIAEELDRAWSIQRSFVNIEFDGRGHVWKRTFGK